MAVYCVIDRSGSMEDCRDDTIGGFNAFLKDQDPETVVSLILFDHEYKEVYKKKASEAPKLTKETFVPRGNTALFDAIGKTIKKVEEPTATIVILTDGIENSSKEFTKNHIKDLIEEKKKQGWNFVYLGANQDAILTAKQFGIDKDSAMTFNTDNVCSAMRSVSCAMARSGRSGGTPIVFTQEERESSVAKC